MREIIVNDKFNNKKLQSFLFYSFDGLTSSNFFKCLRKKDIKINGSRICENVTIYTNDVISIFLDDKLLYKNFNLDVVYEDDNILIINKPNGVEVLNNSSKNLTCIVQSKFNLTNNFPYPCHRLDRNTSGLIIYAKNAKILELLNEEIKQHEIIKCYKCTVIGLLSKKEAILKDYLFKDSKKSIVYISHTPQKGYREIITSYKVLKEDKKNNLSTLDVKLYTGRTHQIRAHLAYIGHPILGDGKYGNNIINKKFNKSFQELCAYKLIFKFKSNSGILQYLNNKEICI